MPLSDNGGTLTLPSPTHVHRVDVSSAVRRLRRSMSRSPSKFNLNSRSSSESPGSSPQSPCRRYSPVFTPYRSQTQMESPSSPQPHQHLSANPRTPSSSALRSNAKLSLRSARFARAQQSAMPSTPSRPRPSPKSPLKRALNASSDSGNSAPSSAASHAPGQENKPAVTAPTSPIRLRCLNKPSRHSLHLDVSGGSHTMFKGGVNGSAGSFSPSAGALKRSDANVDFGTDSEASPVAKRRSLHGASTFASLGQDAHVFDQTTTSSRNLEIHDDSNQEYRLAGSPAVPFIRRDTQPSPTPGASTARRASSLRKSTLQQRYGEKTSWGRRSGAVQLAQLNSANANTNEVATPNPRSRPRISLDAFIPPAAPRDSPFSGTGPLPHPSMHPLPPQIPHPLSRSIKPSFSGNNLHEDTPMGVADQPANNAPDEKVDLFRFSIGPIGPRPPVAGTPAANVDIKSHTPAGTPANVDIKSYTPAAPPPNNKTNMFMSAGLVSKVNRDPEEDKSPVVPDTPCKKSSTAAFATYPPLPGSAFKFGRSPASVHPPDPKTSQDDTFGIYGQAGKGLNLFHKINRRPQRRGSVMDLRGQSESPAAKNNDGRTTPEGFPPTPTKLFFTPSAGRGGINVLESPSANRQTPPISAVKPFVARDPSSSPMQRRGSPKTPQGGVLPLDPSRLSISNAGSTEARISVPVTPTSSQARRLVTPKHSFARSRMEVDAYLLHHFGKVDEVGHGEFSAVYRVAYPKTGSGSSIPRLSLSTPPPGKAFAVKKSRRPFLGNDDREKRLKEVRIIESLRNAQHIVHYIDSWAIDGHLYIQTEYCDEGTLQSFLGKIGRQGRLDDFRIWKIVHDLSLGIKEIHQAGFMHLDLKPANVLITYEGILKIADFGLATDWPAAKGIDHEGDREYIGPEIMQGLFDRPADIFSLGLIALEMGANVQLPENGPTWMALRRGDLSRIPSLTTCSTVDTSRSPRPPVNFEEAISGASSAAMPAPDFGTPKHTPLAQAPAFMTDAAHPASLDHFVRQLTRPVPADRPLIDNILESESLRWVAARRRCAATVFEGQWGPDDAALSLSGIDFDTEMTDV